MLTFEAQQRAFVRQKLREECADLGIEDAEGLRQQLREVLVDPGNIAIRKRFRDLVQRFSEEFMQGIAELDGEQPLDWWRAARWALQRGGMRQWARAVVEFARPDRRAATRAYIAAVQEQTGGATCYEVQNVYSGSDCDDDSYGPLIIGGEPVSLAPPISVCIGTECIPAEPVHVLDALLAPMRIYEPSAEIAARAHGLLERVIDGAVRQLERELEEEFLLTLVDERQEQGQLPS
ncbi:MAG: hypothetical protein Q7R80_00050 [bacterium]|nr:hypothetical protein [bacterium]